MNCRRPSCFTRLRGWGASLLLLVPGVMLPGLEESPATEPLFREPTFEELANITVTTVSKREKRLFTAPAAVSVLTNEEIARSGATSVAEALRWVPGLDVAQVNAVGWAVSSRGFNELYSNKLLVMLDGRSVYTPLFAGVYWDEVNPLLEDLERIEIVRGPGGALWGANAVNGVINILSKSARDTPGTLLYGGGGTEKRVLTGARHGWSINDHTWMRVYASYDLVDETRLPDGTGGHDGFRTIQGGFRLDAEPASSTHLTLQGDVNQGQRERITPLVTAAGTVASDRPNEVNGINLLGRWTRNLAPDSTLTVQAYWDHMHHELVTVTETRDTFDVDLQSQLQPTGRHVITWGAGYRFSGDRTIPGPAGGFVPANYNFQLFNGFVQDEVTLVPARWQATWGVKLEHNSFTGLEVQPSVRLLWTPDEHQTLWASVGRAVRNPNRADDAVEFNAYYSPAGPGQPLPLLVRAYGNQQIKSESLVAWEAGWRLQPQPQVSVDLSVFYHDYDRLILGLTDAAGTFVESTPAPLHLVTPAILRNGARARSCGAELALIWQPTANIRCAPFYSYLKVDAELIQPGSQDLGTLTAGAPRHQVGLRASFDLPFKTKLDCNLRWIGALPAMAIRAYVEMDVRLAWEINPEFELVVSGQNLLNGQHAEFGPKSIESSYELQRGVYAKLTRRF